jgi:hypothetical protein
MGKPFPFFFFFFFFRADVSSEHGSRAGRGAGRVTRGSGHARVGARGAEDKKLRKLHRRVEAREAFSGFDFSGGNSS